MKKNKILILLSCVLVSLGVFQNKSELKKVFADSKIVEFGAFWEFGSYMSWNGKNAFSYLTSRDREHATTAQIAGRCCDSGWKPCGTQARADQGLGAYWDTAHSFYNIK